MVERRPEPASPWPLPRLTRHEHRGLAGTGAACPSECRPQPLAKPPDRDPRPAAGGRNGRFAASWTFGLDDADAGLLTFCEAEPLRETVGKLGPELAAALEHYQAGETTPARLATALSIPTNTAKSRLRLLKERGLLEGSDDLS